MMSRVQHKEPNPAIAPVSGTKVLYKTDRVEVWPMHHDSKYHNVRFPNGSVFYAETEYLENEYEWNGNLSFSHALMAMKEGRRARRRFGTTVFEFWYDFNDSAFLVKKNGTDRKHVNYFTIADIESVDWEIVQ